MCAIVAHPGPTTDEEGRVRAIVAHLGPTTDGGGGGMRTIVTHPGATNWDGSWGGKAWQGGRAGRRAPG